MGGGDIALGQLRRHQLKGERTFGSNIHAGLQVRPGTRARTQQGLTVTQPHAPNGMQFVPLPTAQYVLRRSQRGIRTCGRNGIGAEHAPQSGHRIEGGVRIHVAGHARDTIFQRHIGVTEAIA